MQISNEELSEIKGGFGIVGVLAVLGFSIFLSGILIQLIVEQKIKGGNNVFVK